MIATVSRRLGLRRGAYAVWVVALLVYVLAVFHRSSLAVAGLEATERFGIGAAQLSTFTVLQLVVYAGMQIPVGLALDVQGGKEGAFRFMNALSIARISNNLGDAKTLVTHPATSTHQRLKPEQRVAMGITDGLVRISVGLEHPDDLIEDFCDALDRA